MPFLVATYNVLATAYLGRGDYSGVAPEFLDPDWRTPALVRHVVSLCADLVCLQEVEADLLAELQEGLGPLGYAGVYDCKPGKPDGCATLYRRQRFTLRRASRLYYSDQEKGPTQHSGFVAQLLALEHEEHLLGVANTHLRWDRPGAAASEQVGHRQAVELIEACRQFDPPCRGWVVCGDFNRGPNSEVVATFARAGFAFAHSGRPHVRSAVANGRASLVDHLFHTRSLAARPVDPPALADQDALPGADQPSDHLALRAEFAWHLD